MKRVYPLYGLSGLVSLGYQVAWFRIYVDWFGSTNLTFAMVLCNFIGGLGVGALASRAVAERLGRLLRLSDRLRVYGAVELLVAASVLLLALARMVPADAWGTFPYELRDGIHGPTLVSQLSKLGLAALCVFVPCFFMGVTFPLLCQAFGARDRFPAALYAWNTLGACSGVLLCEFVFLPRLGHDLTLWTMVAANALLGVFFLATGGAPPGSEEPTGRLEVDAGGSPALARSGVLLACAVLSGFLAGSLEADMFKRVAFLSSNSPAAMSFISFWAILAIFLASWTVRAMRSMTLGHVKVAFFAALAIYATTWHFAHPIRNWLVERAYEPVIAALKEQELGPTSVAGRFPTHLWQVLAFAGLFVFPAYLLVSLLLPWVCNRLQSGRRHLGVAYGANTIAFCVGMVGFTWLAPRVSVFYSMKLMIATLAIGAGFLLLVRENRSLAAWKPLAALGALALACAFTPAGFDRSYVSPGQPNALYPVRAMKSNGASTTYVVEAPDGDRLYFDNHSMSGTNHAAQVYMRLMAHFPLLAHPDPQRALLICFGVGNTADAISKHDTIRAIDVVDLNDKVIATAPEFTRYNHGVHDDERVRFIHDDGRNFLNTTDLAYDLITSEPPPPLYAGVYRLYSTEYYAEVLRHLTPAGMMTQWLPVHEMPQEAVDLAVSSFVEVFPHALLFVGIDMEYILLGSPAPIALEGIATRLANQPAVARDLARLEIRGPLQLLARVARGPEALRSGFGGRPTISDQNNDLTFVFAQPLAPGVIRYDPLELLAELGPTGESLRGTATHLGRLRYLAEFPYETLATVPADRAPEVALAGIDWTTIGALRTRCAQLEDAAADGATRERVELLRKGLALGAEQPELLMDLAMALASAGEFDAALAELERLLALVPEDPLAHQRLGFTLLALERTQEALGALRRAVELGPEDTGLHSALAMALGATGDPVGAEAEYRRSLELEPANTQVRLELGILLAQAGRLDDAAELWEEGTALDPRSAQLHFNIGLARQGQARPEEALAAFQRAIEVDASFLPARRALGFTLFDAGELRAALRHLAIVVRASPQDTEASRRLEAAREQTGADGPGS